MTDGDGEDDTQIEDDGNGAQAGAVPGAYQVGTCIAARSAYKHGVQCSILRVLCACVQGIGISSNIAPPSQAAKKKRLQRARNETKKKEIPIESNSIPFYWACRVWRGICDTRTRTARSM